MNDLTNQPSKTLSDLWSDSKDVWSHQKLKLLYWFLISFVAGGIPLWINYLWGRPEDISAWTNIDNGRILFFCITAVSSASTFVIQYKGDQFKDIVRVLHGLFFCLVVAATFRAANAYEPLAKYEEARVRAISLIIFFLTFWSLYFLQVIRMSDATGFLEDKKISETRFAKKPTGN